MLSFFATCWFALFETFTRRKTNYKSCGKNAREYQRGVGGKCSGFWD